MPDGSTYVSGKPDFSQRKFSKEQKRHQVRFQEAAAYARAAAKNQPIYAELAQGTVKSPYNVALSDWFHPPVIHQIERRNGVILIWASDDVMVSKVEVTISGDAGAALAEGEALLSMSGVWEYASEVEGAVRVQVRDLAGNVTQGNL